MIRKRPLSGSLLTRPSVHNWALAVEPRQTFDIDGTAAHVAYERIAKPIDVLLPFWEVFARIDAIGFEQPPDELIGRHHSFIRQEIGDVHRAIIDDRSAPTAFYANLRHQGMEGLSIRHQAMLNEWPHSSKRLTVRNGDNWAKTEWRVGWKAAVRPRDPVGLPD